MPKIIFSTGNANKFITAQHTCSKFGIELVQETADIIEIQSEDPQAIALDKAAKAYALLKKPVVVSDDSWTFAGLNGFPGPYMHSVNSWFTPQDFLRLTRPLKNRAAVFTQYLVYTDGTQQKVFSRQSHGELLKEIRGQSKHPNLTIITLHGDNGQSIAEVFENTTDKSKRISAGIWREFGEWVTRQ